MLFVIYFFIFKRPIKITSSFIFLHLASTRVTLHDWLLKKHLVYLRPIPFVLHQRIHSLREADLAPPPLRPPLLCANSIPTACPSLTEGFNRRWHSQSRVPETTILRISPLYDNTEPRVRGKKKSCKSLEHMESSQLSIRELIRGNSF